MEMASINARQANLEDFLSNGNTFYIPPYQRRYQWGKDECEVLWNDIITFFEDSKKDDDDTYFLGCIVCLNKERNVLEIIDGQQRITTITLLFRALYERANMSTRDNRNILGYIESFGKCIWRYDRGSREFDFDKPFIKSDAAFDDDVRVLDNILKKDIDLNPSDYEHFLYAKNYQYFCKKIDEFLGECIRVADFEPWKRFCEMILEKFIVLPIECNGEENAMRIFNTLNDRGTPLKDADIFKSKIYATKPESKKEDFVKQWKELEAEVEDAEIKGFDVNFLFIQYMHIVRARKGDDGGEIGLRKFYIQRNKEILRDSKLMTEISEIEKLWLGINLFDEDKFSCSTLQMFDILFCYPNDYWKVFVSAYYFYCKDRKIDFFDEKHLLPTLQKLIAMLCVKFIDIQSVDRIKQPIFKAYTNLYKKDSVIFDTDAKNILNDETFKPKLISQKRLTSSLLCLNMYLKYPEQEITYGEIEHIFPKKWQNTNYKGWNQDDAKVFLEQIGNKMWLERKENIQAGNNYFGKKKQKYKNSKFLEASELAHYPKNDWVKEDIIKRNDEIYTRLYKFFSENL